MDQQNAYESIKPIETEYQGYKFRSRLEARYAVFFDTLGVRWEYEKEGYELHTGWYLPDFWLNDSELWVEIKSEGVACPHAHYLFQDTGYPVVVTNGIPGTELTVHVADLTDSSGGSCEWDNCHWCANKDNQLAVNTHDTRSERDFYNDIEFSKETPYIVQEKDAVWHHMIDVAILKAKQFRFDSSFKRKAVKRRV